MRLQGISTQPAQVIGFFKEQTSYLRHHRPGVVGDTGEWEAWRRLLISGGSCEQPLSWHPLASRDALRTPTLRRSSFGGVAIVIDWSRKLRGPKYVRRLNKSVVEVSLTRAIKTGQRIKSSITIVMLYDLIYRPINFSDSEATTFAVKMWQQILPTIFFKL